MSAEPPPRFDPKRRRAVTVALILVSALASFESTVVSTAMPTIIGDLGGLPLYAWVFSVYLLTSTVGMPVYGRLADIHGRRRLLLVGIGVFVTGAIACAFARTMPQLIGARAIQGLGAAGMLPVTLAVAADIYSIEQRTKVQGLFSAVWGFSSLIGPLLGAFLTVHFGWRSIFWINIPLGLFAFTLVWIRMVESRARRSDPVDVAGSAALAVGVSLVLLGVLHTPAGSPGGTTAATRLALLGGGVAALIFFGWLQTRREHPLIPPELFARWETAAPYLAGIVMGTAIYGVDTFVPLFVQGARGGTAGAAGAVVTPLIFMWAFSSAVAAKIILRYGFRKTARLGAILVLIGLAGLCAGAWSNAGVGWISAACALIGGGLGPCAIAQVLAIQHVAPEPQRGVATSLIPFFRTVGGSIGVGALGGVFAAGLSLRLGSGMDTASRLLAGGPPGGGAPGAPTVAPALFRQAIERSLLPVFLVLLALAAVNLFLASGFPEVGASGEPAPKAAEGLV